MLCDAEGKKIQLHNKLYDKKIQSCKKNTCDNLEFG